MRSSYKSLGDYIQPVEARNSELIDLPLMGLSIAKIFIPSIANIIGTDMSTYRIIQKNQFAYGPVTSRNSDKITIALFQEYEQALISQAYIPFEIKNTLELLPEYLMMWFQRPEFDRYARFMSHGSAREIFSWDEMCNTSLPIPSITKQKEVVKEFNVIQDRLALNKKLIERLEEAVQMIYKQWFVEFEFPISTEYAAKVNRSDLEGKPYKSNGGELNYNKELEAEIPLGWEVKKLSDFCEVKGGKRLPKGRELNDKKQGRPYIKVANMNKSKFIVLNEQFEYVDEETQKIISRYITSKGDVIISIVGTIGLVNVIDESLDKANLTENCVRLTNIKLVNSDFIYHFLVSGVGQRLIETKTVGGVQGKLPIYNIQNIPTMLPDLTLLKDFEDILLNVNSNLKLFTMDNRKLLHFNEILLSKLATVEI